jgi:hypothetical protein
MLQSAIDAEVDAFVAMHADRTDERGRRLVVKNGSLPQREILTGAGAIPVTQGRVRDNDTPLVLLCPAWRNWGMAKTLKANSVILHSRQDDVIPFADSEELLTNSGLPSETLIEVGDDHRLADPEPLKALLEACERANRDA